MGLSANLGITPMIGENDTDPEVLTLADAQTVVNYANSNGSVALLSFWALARDQSCAGDGVQSTCSGLSQSSYSVFKNIRAVLAIAPPSFTSRPGEQSRLSRLVAMNQRDPHKGNFQEAIPMPTQISYQSGLSSYLFMSLSHNRARAACFLSADTARADARTKATPAPMLSKEPRWWKAVPAA